MANPRNVEDPTTPLDYVLIAFILGMGTSIYHALEGTTPAVEVIILRGVIIGGSFSTAVVIICVIQLLRFRVSVRSQTAKDWLTTPGFGMPRIRPPVDFLLDEQLGRRCLPLYSDGYYEETIQVAMKTLESRVRKESAEGDSGAYGKALMEAAFNEYQGSLRTGETTAERESFRDLVAGTYGTFRNPTAHRFTNPTREDAFAILYLTNIILKRIEDSPENSENDRE